MISINTFDILGVRVSAVDPDLAVAVINEMVEGRRKGYVCVAPVSTIVDCRRSEEYRQVVNAAVMVTPDGMPVAWLGQRRAGPEVKRTYGPDLMLRLCGEGQAGNVRHFFYGASVDVCDKLEQSLRAKFPNIIVAGKIAPPFTAKAERLSQDVVRVINAAKPDIVWVALGSPKQDFWMAVNREALDVPVMVGIGAAFDFIAGVKPQAPRWMGRMGLEWFFRLCSEPRRLWKRYLVGNTLFVWWVAVEELKGQKVKRSAGQQDKK